MEALYRQMRDARDPEELPEALRSKLIVNLMLDPMRERRAAALARPGYLRDVLFEGSRRARAEAVSTMERVRDAMKLRYK